MATKKRTPKKPAKFKGHEFRQGSHPAKKEITSVSPNGKSREILVTLDANAFKEIDGRTELIPAVDQHPAEKVTSIDRKKSNRISIPKNHRAIVYRPGRRFHPQTMERLILDGAIPSRYNFDEKKEPAPRLKPTDIASDFCRKICEEYSVSEQNKIFLELVSTIRNRREVHANRAESNLREITANRDQRLRDIEALERILRGDFDKLDLAGE